MLKEESSDSMVLAQSRLLSIMQFINVIKIKDQFKAKIKSRKLTIICKQIFM